MRIVTALLLVCGSGAWFWQIRTLASLEQTRDVQASALSQMEIDATTVRRLRASPRRASDRERPNAELLAEVDAAIATSAISKDAWQDSVPQPPRQMVGRPYVQHSTKLYLDGVNLEKVVQFCRALLEADPTLHLLSLRLTAPDRATSDPVPTQLWRVELTIGYLVFAPDSSRGLTVPR